jgi:ubiquinone/menaquinone biosynthesis C-methylase UbiE
VRAGHDALFDRVGIREGARCVDVGCGGGHVSRELARRVGASGSVVGIDLDAALLELASAHVSAAGITNIEFDVATRRSSRAWATTSPTPAACSHTSPIPMP